MKSYRSPRVSKGGNIFIIDILVISPGFEAQLPPLYTLVSSLRENNWYQLSEFRVVLSSKHHPRESRVTVNHSTVNPDSQAFGALLSCLTFHAKWSNMLQERRFEWETHWRIRFTLESLGKADQVWQWSRCTRPLTRLRLHHRVSIDHTNPSFNQASVNSTGYLTRPNSGVEILVSLD